MSSPWNKRLRLLLLPSGSYAIISVLFVKWIETEAFLTASLNLFIKLATRPLINSITRDVIITFTNKLLESQSASLLSSSITCLTILTNKGDCPVFQDLTILTKLISSILFIFALFVTRTESWHCGRRNYICSLKYSIFYGTNFLIEIEQKNTLLKN